MDSVSISNTKTHAILVLSYEEQLALLTDPVEIEEFHRNRENNRVMIRTIDEIFDNLNIGFISTKTECDIKMIIYNSLKNELTYFDMSITEFFKVITHRCVSYFGFKIQQACDIFVFYANYIKFMTSLNFTLEELIIYDYYGYFSSERFSDIYYHTRLLLITSEMSCFHFHNTNYHNVLNIKTILQKFNFHEETLNIVITFIVWSNTTINNKDDLITVCNHIGNNDKLQKLVMKSKNKDIKIIFNEIAATICDDIIGLYD